MICPEIIIFDAIKSILTYIREDFASKEDEKSTILYQVLSDVSVQRYGLFEQAKSVFLKKEGETRFLDVNMFFNPQKVGPPTIHITFPSEQTGQNGIGLDEGYTNQELIEALQSSNSNSQSDSNSSSEGFDEKYRNIFTRRFDTQYAIVITSDNENEVLLIYHTLKALMISIMPYLAIIGVENSKISGGEVRLNTDSGMPPFFVRGLNLWFSYELKVPELLDRSFVRSIIFKGKPIEKKDAKI